jgi:hypothetical protein
MSCDGPPHHRPQQVSSTPALTLPNGVARGANDCSWSSRSCRPTKQSFTVLAFVISERQQRTAYGIAAGHDLDPRHPDLRTDGHSLFYSRSVEQLSDGVLPSVQSVDRRVAAVHERSEVGTATAKSG